MYEFLSMKNESSETTCSSVLYIGGFFFRCQTNEVIFKQPVYSLFENCMSFVLDPPLQHPPPPKKPLKFNANIQFITHKFFTAIMGGKVNVNRCQNKHELVFSD